MTDLKTLKDFYVCGLNCKYEHIIKVSELKQEAIKWVKNEREIQKQKECLNCLDYSFGRADVIIDFFNLTAEDLKSLLADNHNEPEIEPKGNIKPSGSDKNICQNCGQIKGIHPWMDTDGNNCQKFQPISGGKK